MRLAFLWYNYTMKGRKRKQGRFCGSEGISQRHEPSQGNPLQFVNRAVMGRDETHTKPTRDPCGTQNPHRAVLASSFLRKKARYYLDLIPVFSPTPNPHGAQNPHQNPHGYGNKCASSRRQKTKKNTPHSGRMGAFGNYQILAEINRR